MRNWSRGNKIFLALGILFLAGQAIQPTKNKGALNAPTDIAQVINVPDTVAVMLKKSCYDCHSNNTVYPWYDNIFPANWWVAEHIREGKRELNFSKFGEYNDRKQAKKLEEISDQIKDGAMPLKSYLFLHDGARLNEQQQKMLTDWAAKARAEIEAKPLR